MGRYLSQRTMLFLVIFSSAVVVFILASLFTSFTERSLKISSSSSLELGTPQFKTAAEGIARTQAWPLLDEVILFHDGTLFLEDLLKEIGGAEKSVTITNYIFKEGVMTNSTFDALIEKAESGVEVRLLLDAVGGMKAPEDKIKRLKEVGGQVEVFRPTNFRSLTRVHRRSHVRAIVIDGKVGYIGGLAFDDEWLGNGMDEEHWRDLMFKFEGNAARAIQNQFNTLWRNTNGEILSGRAFYPEEISSDEAAVDSYFLPFIHAPAPDVSADLLNLIWLTITGAEKQISLATPYLTPPAEIVEALKNAVERGVTVELIVPGTHTDNTIVQSASRAFYEELLEAGVHIYEYQPGRFHSKFLTVDGHWSLIGSPNMDNRSATLNVENAFAVENRALATALENEFQDNLSHSQKIHLEEFRPNIFKRFYYGLTALFVKQL